MDTRSKLVALALWLASGAAVAGYAYPNPPAGVTGSVAAPMARVAANDSVVTQMIRTPNGPIINTGGRAVTLPAAMRFAANAGQYAARGIHPMIIAGIVLAPVVLDWLTSAGLGVQNGLPVQKNDLDCTVAPCYGYTIFAGSRTSEVVSTLNEACTVSIAAMGYQFLGLLLPDGCQFNRGFGPERAGIRVVEIPPKPVSWKPATVRDFEEAIAPHPMPDAVPKLLPFPLPIDPLPWLNPTPGNNPQSQPLRLPQGSPQPVPNTNPQQWRQPVIDVKHAPAPGTPWRVELVPRDIITDSPAPLPEQSPVPDAPDPAKQPETESDLCIKNPDILACQKVTLGELEPVAFGNTNKNLAITKDTGWGPSSGSCPAPKTANVLGITLTFPFTLICDVAEMIRPLIIGFAWLSAAMVFFGIGRRD